MKPAFFIFFSAIIFLSCKKESFITSADASLYASVDTLFFDTVFTSAGSVTQSFKIFNNNNQKLRLSQVKLSGGAASPFKINIDGAAASQVNDIEINANDSLYVFVQVNVNPSGSRLPFVLSDSIQIDYNGNTQFVQLQAYGQNAIFLKNAKLTTSQTWDRTLPFVIIGGLQVDTGVLLNISQGTKIYLHANAPFLVDGNLQVGGTKEFPVVFSGDRLDEEYKDLPGSWPGIYLRASSQNNILKHAIIKNAYQGIIVQGLSTTGPKLTLSQCIIDNIYDAGILGTNTNINADNCLITNCGSNITLNLGGNYRFTNCTVATYGNLYITHKNPVLQITNFSMESGTNVTAPLNALFTNCIFWGENGNVDDEIAIGKQGAGPFSVTFNHVLYKAKTDPSEAHFISSIKNIPPAFDSINVSRNIYDFHFTKDATAPAINAGIVTPFPFDLDGKPRDAAPDIGSYER